MVNWFYFEKCGTFFKRNRLHSPWILCSEQLFLNIKFNVFDEKRKKLNSLHWNTSFPAVTICEIYNGEKNWDLSERFEVTNKMVFELLFT